MRTLCAHRACAGCDVVVLDSHNNWPYPEAWKAANLKLLRGVAGAHGRRLIELRGDCAERRDVDAAFAAARVDSVLHLAAVSGVSGGRAEDTVRANVCGTAVVADAARHAGARRLVLASSGAVYGDRPWGAPGARETDPTDAPVSVYAASKRSAELVAHAASCRDGPDTTVLRLFTVYGPRGRPDMAPFRFVRDVVAGTPISVQGDGSAWRDFVHVDDAVAALTAALLRPQAHRFAVFNVASGTAVRLREFVAAVEAATARSATLSFVAGRPGDVGGTHADVSAAAAGLAWQPQVSLEEGLRSTVAWWRSAAADEYRTDSSSLS